MKALRPYLYSAYYHWIVDSDYVPYLVVNANYPNVDVPREFVNEQGEIVLNLSPNSIGQYVNDDKAISFNARFQGVVRSIYIPFGAMLMIYAREDIDRTFLVFPEEAHYVETSSTSEASKAEKRKVLKLVK